MNIHNTIYQAIKNRQVRYYRYDNSPYCIQYYKNKIDSHDLTREKSYANYLLTILPKGAKVLDVGSGFGLLALELKRAGFDVIALDLFPEMINEAKKYFKKKNADIKIIKSDLIKTPFNDNEFDAVTCISILEHFPASEMIGDVIPEIRRIVKTGGYVLIHTPIKTAFSNLCRFYRKYVTRDLPEWAIDDDGDVTHKEWWQLNKYIKTMENAGFEIVDRAFYSTRSNRKPLLLWKLGKIFENYIKNELNYKKNGIINSKSGKLSRYGEILSITGDLFCIKI